MEMEHIRFLVEAKKASYASGDASLAVTSADGTKELTYQREKWLYRDRYYGSDPFFGGELLFHDGKAVWGMNYMGWLVLKEANAGEVYRFLQAALRNVDESSPYRVPAEYQQGSWLYLDEHQGNQDRFTGIEYIMYKTQEVYRLVYHGGLIGN
jgi:hypothetical protein